MPHVVGLFLYYNAIVCETYPQYGIVVGTALRDGRRRGTRAATKVRIVTRRMQHPIVPANIRKRYVQMVTAARRYAGRTVEVALQPLAGPAVAVRIDHNERPIVVVQPQQIQIRMRIAGGARDVNHVRQVVVLDPALHFAGNVDFHPDLCGETHTTGRINSTAGSRTG